MRFSPYDLVRRRAKMLARESGASLAEEGERLAKEIGFSHHHDMATVAKRTPEDPRLLHGAFGIKVWADLLGHPLVEEPAELSNFLEDELSAAIASSNSVGFYADDWMLEESRYDIETGSLVLVLDVHYAGKPDPDRGPSQSVFNLLVAVNLRWDTTTWQRADEPFGLLEWIEPDDEPGFH